MSYKFLRSCICFCFILGSTGCDNTTESDPIDTGSGTGNEDTTSDSTATSESDTAATGDSDSESDTADDSDSESTTSQMDSDTGNDTDTEWCYSPKEHTQHAYDEGATGCPCDATIDYDICMDGVALMCISNHWQAVEDGPCMPQTWECYTPANPDSMQDADTGCPCDPQIHEAICNGYGFVCEGGVWQWVLDGPCGE